MPPVIGWILGIVFYAGMLWFFITEFGTLLVNHIKQSRAYIKREQELRSTIGPRRLCFRCPYLRTRAWYPKGGKPGRTIPNTISYCRKFKITVYYELQPCQAKNPDEALREEKPNKQEVAANE